MSAIAAQHVAAVPLPDSRAQVWRYPSAKLFEDTLEHGANEMAKQRASTQRGSGRHGRRHIDVPAPRPVGRVQGETDSEDERAADPLARATEKRMRHDNKECTPCFFWYYLSCSQGEKCAYCHIKHPKSDYKALRRARPERERGRRQLSPEAVPWNGSSRSNEFGPIAL